jgi:hypothetical protein
MELSPPPTLPRDFSSPLYTRATARAGVPLPLVEQLVACGGVKGVFQGTSPDPEGKRASCAAFVALDTCLRGACGHAPGSPDCSGADVDSLLVRLGCETVTSSAFGDDYKRRLVLDKLRSPLRESANESAVDPATPVTFEDVRAYVDRIQIHDCCAPRRRLVFHDE